MASSSTSWPLTARECVLQGTRTLDGGDYWQEIFDRAGIDDRLPLEMNQKMDRMIGQEIFDRAMSMRGKDLAELKLIVFKMLWRYHPKNFGGESKNESKGEDEGESENLPSDEEIIDGSMEDLRGWIFNHLHFPGQLFGEVQHLTQMDNDYETQAAIAVLDADRFNRLFNRYAATTCLPLVPNPNPYFPPSAV